MSDSSSGVCSSDLSAYDIVWAADRDAAAKYRPNSSGGDYYGILKRTAGVPAVLSEAAFISNPAEEALLADPAFQAVEAEAITQAVVRYVSGDQPADDAFVEPSPRPQPAPPGGGRGGSADPPPGCGQRKGVEVRREWSRRCGHGG